MPDPPNLPLKTVGGAQFWTDHLWRDGWRLQQHCWTRHWRLLDDQDVRRAWGSRESCLQALDRFHPVSSDDASPQHVVVLLHGLLRTYRSMVPLEEALKELGQLGDKPAVPIHYSYASSRKSIPEHAASLREMLEGLPRETEISFVGHSMGNIVVRRLIGDLQHDGDPHGLLQRCQAMVMIGPPNQGAAIARRLSRLGLFKLVTGPGGMALGPDWEESVDRLATPPFPFAIIAGDRSDSAIQNPLVEGEGDFIVSVEEAKLEGAEKFMTIDAMHSFMMQDPQAIQMTLEFLQEHAGS